MAEVVYNLLRYGVGDVKKTAAEYIEQTRQRVEKHLHRRAQELGCELVKVEEQLQEVVMSDGEVVLVKADGEIVNTAMVNVEAAE